MTAKHSPNRNALASSGRTHRPLFPLGRLVATPGALELLTELALSPMEFVSRHAKGDWGNLDAEDVQANRAALQFGSRLVSSYQIGSGQKLWIITEADRSITTLLLPSEY